MYGLSRYRKDYRCPDGQMIYECLDCGWYVWDTTRHNERHHAVEYVPEENPCEYGVSG